MSEQERETMKKLIELTKKASCQDKMYILGVAQGMAIKAGTGTDCSTGAGVGRIPTSLRASQ